MKLPRRRQFLRLATGAVALLVVSCMASAQTYPTRPVTIVVPFAAGGGADLVARILAERIRGSLGQPVIVENVIGAAGSIAVGRVARAAPDGYVLSIGNWATHVANGALYPLQYDLMKDFEPISLIALTRWLIVARKTIPADDLKGFVTWLKQNPDKASAGTAGSGSAEHITALLFRNATGTRFQFVPYRGAAPAMQDMIAGQIDMMFTGPSVSTPHLRAGSVKSYAVMAKDRLLAAPDVPTVDEAGLPGLYFSYWQAVWAPKGTPRTVVDRLNAAIGEAVADPAVTRRLADLGYEVFPREQQTPEALGALQKAEIEKWWPIIKAAGIKTE